MKLKHLIPCLLAAALLCAVLLVPAAAADAYVYDTARLLTDGERMNLESAAAEVSREYGCGVYIVTVEDYRDYSSVSVYEAAKAIYTGNDFGEGAERSGVMLLLSMDGRDYSLIAYGYGNTAFTDYGKDRLTEYFLDNFRNGDWYGGFSDYVKACGDYLYQAGSGSPVDVYAVSEAGDTQSRGLTPLKIVFIIVLSCLIAFIVCGVSKRGMKSVKKATGAALFAVPNSLDMQVSQDVFSHVTETRVLVESERDRDSGGGSGGGTTVDSSGFSGTSGKF